MGLLLVAATPIGNLGDSTRRLVETLGSDTVVACEDTRVFHALCSGLGVRTPRYYSYHNSNEKKRTPELLDLLNSGVTVLLVSSAGTPLMSDPGYRIVKAAIEAGHTVSPIPGPCAAIAALSCSGLRVDRFAFLGFPSRRPGKLRRELESMRSFEGTLIFYESPLRVLKLAGAALSVYGPAPAVLARELTKVHEEFLRLPLNEMVEALSSRTLKGECCMLIEIRGDGWVETPEEPD